MFFLWLYFIIKETDFSSFADDNTTYRTAETIDEVIKLLECESMTADQMVLWQPNESKY